jgi:uncharacterized SAM-binding protein YcdF (DUF218 family)
VNLAATLLLAIYDSLTLDDPPHPVDLIFVLAGRMERKRYGLELHRAGLAPSLLLSIGRFEVSRMPTVDLAGLDELKALRDGTAPDDRHFFIQIDASDTRIEKARLPRWSTYGEAIAFRRFWESGKAKTVMVISTDVHLRRAALTYAEVFRGVEVQFQFCSVPPSFGFLKRSGWWTRPGDRWFVIREFVKLVGYRLILSAPTWAIPRLMRVQS